MNRLRNWWRILNEVMADIDRLNLGLIAAGCAFFGMISIFPAISAIISIFGIVADPAVVLEQLRLLEDFIPREAYVLLTLQIGKLLQTSNDALGWTTGLSILVAIWTARAGVDAIMRGLNEIYGRPKRGGLRRVLVALLLTVSLVAVAITALLAVVISPILLAFLPLGPYQLVLAEALRWGLAIAVIVLGLGILYRFGPNAKGERPRWFTAGAAVVVVGWLVASVLFSLYLSNFANYNRVYGSIGAVMALLMWFYITAYLVLMGAVLNLRLWRREQRRLNERARLAD